MSIYHVTWPDGEVVRLEGGQLRDLPTNLAGTLALATLAMGHDGPIEVRLFPQSKNPETVTIVRH